VDSDLNTLTELNPSLMRLTTPKDSTYDLRLPAGTKDKFEQAIAAIPLDKRVAWRYHHVAPGDSLDSIARHYHASPRSIEEVNGLHGEELRADSKIIIPVTAGKTPGSTQVAYSHTPTHYKVRHGDTVLSVADDFGVTADRLRRWNHLKGDELAHGRLLVIYRPVLVREDTVINSPSRHSSSKHRASNHRTSTKTAHTASKSAHKTTSQTASSKSTPTKSQTSSAANHAASGSSEHTSASLR
jgi:membrane-bound lytic murein transglycosylase D